MAEKYKKIFIDRFRIEDPWEKQGYHEVNLNDDIKVNPIKSHIEDDNVILEKVYVISHYFEGFGQTDRHFISVHIGLDNAEQEVKKLKIKKEQFPNYFEIDEINVTVA